jgi:hypothetical protein
MKERITIKIDPEDAKKALVKGIKEMSREHAKLGRSLQSQTFASKKGGGESARKYPKHRLTEDLDEEDLKELKAKLKEGGAEEKI